MKIQSTSLQNVDLSQNLKTVAKSKTAASKDSVQIGGNNLRSITQGVSNGVMGRILGTSTTGNYTDKAKPTGINSAETVFTKTEKWQSSEMNGILSMPAVYSPANDCFFTGMVGKGYNDQKVGKRYLTAFNPDGSLRWVYRKESITAEPAFDDKGNIYIRSQNHITALDKNGKETWSCEAKGRSGLDDREEVTDDELYEEDQPPQVASDGTVYTLVFNDTEDDSQYGCNLAAIKDGKEIWRSVSINTSDGENSFVVKGDNTYFYKPEKKPGAKGINDEEMFENVLCCMSSDNKEKFKIQVSEPYEGSPSFGPAASEFCVGDDGSIAVNLSEEKIALYSPDGVKQWDQKAATGRFSEENSIFHGPPVILNDGKVLIKQLQRDNIERPWQTVLAKFNTDGKQIWKLDLCNHESSKPMISENGDIFIKVKNIEQKTDEIIQVNEKGRVINRFTEDRDEDMLEQFFDEREEEISAIQSFELGPDNTLLIETFNPQNKDDKWVYNRGISVINTGKEYNPTSSKIGKTEKEPGKIEKTKEYIVINGVKVPVHERN